MTYTNDRNLEWLFGRILKNLPGMHAPNYYEIRDLRNGQIRKVDNRLSETIATPILVPDEKALRKVAWHREVNGRHRAIELEIDYHRCALLIQTGNSFAQMSRPEFSMVGLSGSLRLLENDPLRALIFSTPDRLAEWLTNRIHEFFEAGQLSTIGA